MIGGFMKRKILIPFFLLVMLLFTGCFYQTAKTLEECEMDTWVLEHGEGKVEVELYYDNKSVRFETVRYYNTYRSLGVTNEEEAKVFLDQDAERYQGIPGLSHVVLYDENGVKETVSVDYAALDSSKAKQIPWVFVKDDKGEVSLEKARKILKDGGFRQKKQEVGR